MKFRILCVSLILIFCMVSLYAEEKASPLFFFKKMTIEELREVFGENVSEDIPNFHGTYILQAKNFQPKQKFKLYCRNLRGEELKVGDCFTNKDGKMMLKPCNKKEIIELSNNFIGLGNFLPGEPLEYLLIPSGRGHAKKYTAFVFPNPMEVEDEEGRKIAMNILTPDLMNFGFKFTNFKPNEKILKLSISGNEVIIDEWTIAESGSAIQMISPAVIGKERGKAILRVIPLETGMSMEICYDWGWPKK